MNESWGRNALDPIFDETRVFTVSQLNAQIKGLLEASYRYIWVRGEISNLRIPASGHYYFTLKDEESQLRAVLFRSHQRNLRFTPEDGLEVLCQGRVSVYEPRGEYQLIAETIEPKGLGALQLAFEQLKKKLQAEGLFDPALKTPLPVCPQRIAIVTSATGAAIQDMLKVLKRSPYPLEVSLLPVRVQGAGAAAEIAAALEAVSHLREDFQWDLVIVGRGGGSIEDLWPFNEEIVARSIVACPVPVISAVGHEIDLTISDLVSDFRAPTPTAAADWVVGRLDNFQREIRKHLENLEQRILRKIETYKQMLDHYAKRLADPRKRLDDLHLYVDDRLERLQLSFNRKFERLRMSHKHLAEKLLIYNPQKTIRQDRLMLQQQFSSLILHQRNILDRSRFALQKSSLQLESLSPLGVLARGYSITYRLPDNKVLREGKEIQSGQRIRVQLSRGALEGTVEKVEQETSRHRQRGIQNGKEKE